MWFVILQQKMRFPDFPLKLYYNLGYTTLTVHLSHSHPMHIYELGNLKYHKKTNIPQKERLTILF